MTSLIAKTGETSEGGEEEVVVKCDPFEPFTLEVKEERGTLTIPYTPEVKEERGTLTIAESETLHLPFSLNVAEANLSRDYEKSSSLTITSFPTEPSSTGYVTYGTQEQSVGQTKEFYNVPETLNTTQVTYNCYYCCVSFAQRSELEQHVKIHAGQGEKRYKCQICKTGFTQKRNFMEHEKRHKNGSIRKCEICKKIFFSTALFKKHQNIHRLEMPYRCDICDSRFYFKDELEYHKASIHNISPEIQTVVVKQSNEIEYLQIKHEIDSSVENISIAKKIVKSNIPNVCNICGKQFSSTFLYQKHMKCHYLEMPYKCDMCGVRFYYKNEFESHGLLHS